MYGLIGKMTAVPGQRDALAAILLEGTDAMPGCLSYVVVSVAALPRYAASCAKLPDSLA
jgi:quinol monooxygenase YgiN